VALKKCIACAEEIQAQAKLCRFCDTRQDDANFSSPVASSKSSKNQGVATKSKIANRVNEATANDRQGLVIFFAILALIVVGVASWAVVNLGKDSTRGSISASDNDGLVFQPLRAGEIPFTALSPGMCVNDANLPEGFDFEGLPGANCSEPHDSEVVKIGVVPSSSYPLSEQVMQDISELCVQGFEEYTGLNYDAEPNLSVSAYTPSKREWDNGHRIFVCVAWSLDGQKLTSSLSVNSGISNSASGDLTVREVYEIAIPSVVTVECGYSQGTGFAYDVEPADGFRTVIVTNHHVIEDCTFSGGPDVTIYTQDNRTPSALLWNWDEENDLATIMIDISLPVLLDGPEGAIGDPVVAVGSPLGFSGTITTGIISQIYEDAYQTDAAVNPGNSGGPLLDMRGRLLGVTTLGFGREGLNIAFRQALLCDQLITCN
jgi:hypothetical protein